MRPCARRTSRHATFNSELLPPWPLRNTSRLAGSVATDRPMSESTDNMVVADNHTVPEDHACSFDFV
jgi:hypothetical protein